MKIEEIRKIIKETGWTQEDLAREIGVTTATVNRWLNGRTRPSRLAIRMLERVIEKV